MRFGYFIAIITFCLTIIFSVVFYWDLQDGIFSSKLLFTPILLFNMTIILLIFPGSKLSSEIEIGFLENLTPRDIKVIIIGFAVTLYFNFWAQAYFTNEPFFTIGKQILLALSFGVVFFIAKIIIFKK